MKKPRQNSMSLTDTVIKLDLIKMILKYFMLFQRGITCFIGQCALPNVKFFYDSIKNFLKLNTN